jgi:hypothetical protein
VQLISVPSQLLGARFNLELAQRTLESGLKAAKSFHGSPAAAAGGSLQVEYVADLAGFEKFLDGAEIVAAAGPAGLCILPLASWSRRSNLKWLLDFNLTEPFGIEGVKPGDDFAGHEGKRALGALAIGNLKMKVHKACIAKLFERNDLVLDTEGVYNITKELI